MRRNFGIPSGSVFQFAGLNAPYGYLICDGRAVSRTDYADLFSAIGTLYGSGNGSTTFNLPDYRGQFVRGRVDFTTITGSSTTNSTSRTATFMNHGVNRTGFKVRLNSGTLSPLAGNTDYYAIVIDQNTLAFATTYALALTGVSTITDRVAISGANSAVLVQYEDPDYDSRTSSNNLGSRQEDAFQGHRHRISAASMGGNQAWKGGAYWASADGASGPGYKDTDDGDGYPSDSSRGPSRSGKETRPRNVLANYIIKI